METRRKRKRQAEPLEHATVDGDSRHSGSSPQTPQTFNGSLSGEHVIAGAVASKGGTINITFGGHGSFQPPAATATAISAYQQDAPARAKLTQDAKDCLQSLAFPEMQNRSHDIGTAALGTCGWLLSHNTYLNWMSSNRGLLWIKGKPGSGKSILLRYAIRHLEKETHLEDETFVLSFFFHGRGSELQRTRLGLVRSLLHQLLERIPNHVSDVVAAFQNRQDTIGKYGTTWNWHQNELQEFFRLSLARLPESHTLWLFVDALDEISREDAVFLVQEFKSLLNNSPGPALRICFACRHYPVLDHNCQFEICPDINNGNDIATFVHTQFAVSRTLSESSIPSSIIDRAKGVFIWARLVVEEALRLDYEGQGLKTIENKVNLVPPKLNELYEELIGSIDDKRTSLKLIQWVCFATRPLSLEELRWAIVMDADSPYESLKECQNIEDYVSNHNVMERRLKTLSRGLVEVVSSFVQCIHQSVLDFLLKEGLLVLSGAARALETDAEASELRVGIAHRMLARSCMRYLLMKEIAEFKVRKYGASYQLRANFPFLSYAAGSWIDHLKGGETGAIAQDDTTQLTSWLSDAQVQSWARIYNRLYPRSDDRLAKGATLAHFASQHQLMRLLYAMIQKPEDFGVYYDARDDNGTTPLSLATRNGYESAVKLLLDTGRVDPETQNNEGQAALHIAAENGNIAVTKLLLDTGRVDIRAKNKNGRSALDIATSNKHDSIVELLSNRTNLTPA